MSISAAQKETFFTSLDRGYSRKDACRRAGFSIPTANRLLAGPEGQARAKRLAEAEAEKITGPIPYDKLTPEAKEAWDDFGVFQRRYFGRIPYPWQVEAANTIVDLLATPDREFCVINLPPGAGKTSTFTLQIPAWLTVRNRAIRGLIGHASQKEANKNVLALRRFFERAHPMQGKPDEIAKGRALDAISTVARDFGRFRSDDVWASDQFIVAQYAERELIQEKEATWSAYGADTEYTGNRVDYAVWDDLVSLANQSTDDQRLKVQTKFDDVAENRLEPGGLLALCGQRLLSMDLYRYCLDKRVMPDDEEDDTEQADDDEPSDDQDRVYHHIVFKDHYEDRCEPKFHAKNAPPYPEGCLLVPNRITWRDVRRHREYPNYRIVQQQEDGDPESAFVTKAAIYGDDGYPGCLDRERGNWEIPRGIDPGRMVIATCDPSPSKFWAIEVWIWDPVTEFRHLINLERRAMTASAFLDYDYSKHGYVGLMHEWHMKMASLGFPIDYWVVEANAAQKFMFQYNHFNNWRAMMGANVVAHTTNQNKADPLFGVQTLPRHYNSGRVRLPYRAGDGRLVSLKLISEVTSYRLDGKGGTDDTVMAHWFMEFQLPKLYRPDRGTGQSWRPSWVRRSA